MAGEDLVVELLFFLLFIADTFIFPVLLRNINIVELMLPEFRFPQTTLSAHIFVHVLQSLVCNDNCKMRPLMHRCPVAGHTKVADTAYNDHAN